MARSLFNLEPPAFDLSDLDSSDLEVAEPFVGGGRSVVLDLVFF